MIAPQRGQSCEIQKHFFECHNRHQARADGRRSFQARKAGCEKKVFFFPHGFYYHHDISFSSFGYFNTLFL
jgi:hypothetical protein